MPLPGYASDGRFERLWGVATMNRPRAFERRFARREEASGIRFYYFEFFCLASFFFFILLVHIVVYQYNHFPIIYDPYILIH